MKNKLTLVKVGNKNYSPSSEDLKYWADRFQKGVLDLDEMKRCGIVVEQLDFGYEEECYLTLVKIGDDSYKPSPEDLEFWKRIFEEAKSDPDFKIFTHSAVNVERVKMDKNMMIIIGDTIVIKKDSE